ncbi:MAG: hypothetical protein K2X74_04440, partial [Acetobacteraceae bacterium]|nr:hypothetical protein [Acetobacteraceae bacterium]
LAAATGAITQTGAISGTDLAVTANGVGGSVTLTNAANSVATVGGSSAGAFAFTEANGFSVSGIAAGGAVTLTAVTGTVTQSGAITGTDLTVTANGAGGSVTLTNAGNSVATVGGNALGGFAFAEADGFVVSGLAAGGAANLTALAGAITQTGAITAPGLRAVANGVGGAVQLTNPGNLVGTLAASATGNLLFTNGQALTIGTVQGLSGILSTGAGSQVALRTLAGDLIQAAGDITALGAGSQVSLVSEAGTIRQNAGIVATRQLALRGGAGGQLGNLNQLDQLAGADFGVGGGLLLGQSYAVTGAVTSVGNLALRAVGNLAVGSATLTPPIRSTAGGVTLASSTGQVSIGASLLQAAAPGLTISGPAGVTLTGTQISSQGGATITALPGPVTMTNVQADVAGAMAVTAGGDLTLTGTRAAAGGTLNIGANGALRVANSSLESATGPVIEGLTLRGNTGVDIQNSVLAAGSRITVNGGFGLTMGGNTRLLADSAFLAGAGITLGTVAASIGTNILLWAPGGITNLVPFPVTPRVGGQFPAVIYDTRAAPPPGQSPDAILGYVRPDLPGLPPEQQPTQLRSQPGLQAPDLFFGRAGSGAGGPIALDIQAGQSPVFLLLDGGSASGNIVAGRLLVHGTGGRVSVFGTLNGLAGAQAANASDITQPATAGSLQDYRVNSCVIGSVNCVLTPRFQPIPPTVRTNVEFSIRQSAFNPADVIIPNTGENDYE